MDLTQCYAALGGDYADALRRLQSEALVRKFALKFLDDDSFPSLKGAMALRDRETAFRAAHTLKGVCQNLSFTALGASSAALTEALRTQWDPSADALFPQVEADYLRTVQALSSLREG